MNLIPYFFPGPEFNLAVLGHILLGLATGFLHSHGVSDSVSLVGSFFFFLILSMGMDRARGFGIIHTWNLRVWTCLLNQYMIENWAQKLVIMTNFADSFSKIKFVVIHTSSLSPLPKTKYTDI